MTAGVNKAAGASGPFGAAANRPARQPVAQAGGFGETLDGARQRRADAEGSLRAGQRVAAPAKMPDPGSARRDGFYPSAVATPNVAAAHERASGDAPAQAPAAAPDGPAAEDGRQDDDDGSLRWRLDQAISAVMSLVPAERPAPARHAGSWPAADAADSLAQEADLSAGAGDDADGGRETAEPRRAGWATAGVPAGMRGAQDRSAGAVQAPAAAGFAHAAPGPAPSDSRSAAPVAPHADVPADAARPATATGNPGGTAATPPRFGEPGPADTRMRPAAAADGRTEVTASFGIARASQDGAAEALADPLPQARPAATDTGAEATRTHETGTPRATRDGAPGAAAASPPQGRPAPTDARAGMSAAFGAAGGPAGARDAQPAAPSVRAGSPPLARVSVVGADDRAAMSPRRDALLRYLDPSRTDAPLPASAASAGRTSPPAAAAALPDTPAPRPERKPGDATPQAPAEPGRAGPASTVSRAMPASGARSADTPPAAAGPARNGTAAPPASAVLQSRVPPVPAAAAQADGSAAAGAQQAVLGADTAASASERAAPPHTAPFVRDQASAAAPTVRAEATASADPTIDRSAPIAVADGVADADVRNAGSAGPRIGEAAGAPAASPDRPAAPREPFSGRPAVDLASRSDWSGRDASGTDGADADRLGPARPAAPAAPAATAVDGNRPADRAERPSAPDMPRPPPAAAGRAAAPPLADAHARPAAGSDPTPRPVTTATNAPEAPPASSGDLPRTEALRADPAERSAPDTTAGSRSFPSVDGSAGPRLSADAAGGSSRTATSDGSGEPARPTLANVRMPDPAGAPAPAGVDAAPVTADAPLAQDIERPPAGSAAAQPAAVVGPAATAADIPAPTASEQLAELRRLLGDRTGEPDRPAVGAWSDDADRPDAEAPAPPVPADRRPAAPADARFQPAPRHDVSRETAQPVTATVTSAAAPDTRSPDAAVNRASATAQAVQSGPAPATADTNSASPRPDVAAGVTARLDRRAEADATVDEPDIRERRSPAADGAGQPGEQAAGDRTTASQPAAATAASPAAPLPAPQPAGSNATAVVTAIASYQGWRPGGVAPAHAAAMSAPAQPVHALQIQLHPAELGMVTANLKASGNRLSIDLQVESHEAYRRLSGDGDAIVGTLRAMGYDIDRVTVQQPPASAGGMAQSDGGFAGGSSSREASSFQSGGSDGGGRSGGQGDRSGTEHHEQSHQNQQPSPGGNIYI